MERFKQTIAKLENDVAELKQFQTKIQGSTQSSGDIHYCTGAQEFGEYELDEIDTFRFAVAVSAGQNNINLYNYRLLNPTPEFAAYLKTQGKHEFVTEYIPINIENFEFLHELLQSYVQPKRYCPILSRSSNFLT